MYVEMDAQDERSAIVEAEIFKEHLGVYFRYFDSDYNDLKRLIGVDPLVVTMLPPGTIRAFEHSCGRILPRVNPKRSDLLDLESFRKTARRSGKEERP